MLEPKQFSEVFSPHIRLRSVLCIGHTLRQLSEIPRFVYLEGRTGRLPLSCFAKNTGSVNHAFTAQNFHLDVVSSSSKLPDSSTHTPYQGPGYLSKHRPEFTP